MTGLRAAWRRLRNRPERGAGGEALELLILVPAFLALIAALVAVGRFNLGSGKIDQAAGAAARAASQQATAEGAQTAAATAATSTLTSVGVSCLNFAVTVDTGGYAAPPGGIATVNVTVSCTVQWSDLSVPGWPGSKTLVAQASSPLDTRRLRT